MEGVVGLVGFCCCVDGNRGRRCSALGIEVGGRGSDGVEPDGGGAGGSSLLSSP